MSIAGGMAWFGPYTPQIPTETEDENGDPITVYVNGPEITELSVWDLALNLVWAIDVSRVVPFFSLGAVAARVAERQAGAQVTDVDVGLRVDLGFDYELVEHLSLGALAGLDTYFTGKSQYGSSFHFTVRLTVFWDLAELGRGDDSD